jgi:hypothetical protein
MTMDSRFMSFEIKYQPAQPARADQPAGQPDQLKPKWHIEDLQKIKDELNTTKSQLDTLFIDKRFAAYWRLCDPFVNERDTVAKLGDTFNVSNAWIKCYEIEKYYNMIPNYTDKYIHFDNAAFPGSFILATHHYIATQRDWLENYEWHGNSLIEHNAFTTTQLEDKYGLYKNYPANWMMSNGNNGDVLKATNQRDFAARFGGQVDLYTSDLGFDVSSDFNNQELIQAPANIGQILSGLLTLKRGGCLITKQFSIFEPVTLSVIYMVAKFFKHLYVAKPYTSRDANSEIYLVGVGFLEQDAEYIDVMFNALTDCNAAVLKSEPSREFLQSVTAASIAITKQTILKIKSDVDRIARAMALNWRGPFGLNPVMLEYTAYESPFITNWYRRNYINAIDDADRLNIIDIWKQRERRLF